MVNTVELAMAVANPGAKMQSMANEMVDLEGGEEEKEDEGPCGDRTLKTRIAQGVAGASIVVNVIAIAIEQSGVMIVAGIIALIIGPIVIMQQFKLQDVGSMREVQNKLRKNVNQLQEQNNKLSAENTELEGEVAKLKEVEARLELITVEQGTNVNELVALVKENQEILDKQTRVVRGETVQALMSAIVSSQDTDPKITDREINKVMLKLENLPSIEIDEEGIRKLMIGKELSIEGVFKMIKEMEELPKEQQVIHFK